MILGQSLSFWYKITSGSALQVKVQPQLMWEALMCEYTHKYWHFQSFTVWQVFCIAHCDWLQAIAAVQNTTCCFSSILIADELKSAAMGRNPLGFTNKLLLVKTDSGLLNGFSVVWLNMWFSLWDGITGNSWLPEAIIKINKKSNLALNIPKLLKTSAADPFPQFNYKLHQLSKQQLYRQGMWKNVDRALLFF